MPNYKPPRPLTIAEQGGLEAYLDSEKQKAKHNGLGYKEFSAMVFNETPVVRIMDKMNVKAPITVRKWIALYKEVQQ